MKRDIEGATSGVGENPGRIEAWKPREESAFKERVWVITYILELFVIGVLAFFVICIGLYMLITLGATLVKKFKVGAIIGFIVGADYACSILSVTGSISVSIWINATSYLFADKVNEDIYFYTLFFGLLMLIFMLLSTVALFYNITQGLIDRKLNLQ